MRIKPNMEDDRYSILSCENPFCPEFHKNGYEAIKGYCPTCAFSQASGELVTELRHQLTLNPLSKSLKKKLKDCQLWTAEAMKIKK